MNASRRRTEQQNPLWCAKSDIQQPTDATDGHKKQEIICYWVKSKNNFKTQNITDLFSKIMLKKVSWGHFMKTLINKKRFQQKTLSLNKNDWLINSSSGETDWWTDFHILVLSSETSTGTCRQRAERMFSSHGGFVLEQDFTRMRTVLLQGSSLAVLHYG